MTRTIALAAALALTGGAHGTQVSANWTGYVASGTAFRSVSAAWTEPRANCLNVSSSAVSFWVGLGGATRTSKALEQIGSESDCDPDGLSEDSVWYELWPAPPQPAHLRIAAGDALWASVTVRGTRATLELDDRSTHASFTRTVRLRKPDTSTAEWIAEAPVLRTGNGSRLATLTDFETFGFTDARAVSAGGKAGTIAGPGWHSRVQELRTKSNVQGAADVVPEPLSADGSAFTVRWRRHT